MTSQGFLIFVGPFILYLVFSTLATEKIKAKNVRIKELEYEISQLKSDKHTDSVISYHVDLFKKQLDSIANGRILKLKQLK